jgi:pimeloyl-ACP methyl ester carboxylesterase
VPYAIVRNLRIYYELTGPEDGPLVLQFGGSLFGRQNFWMVNDAFRERFRLLSYDYSGYGRSDCPVEHYTIEGWAAEAAELLGALGIERMLTHGRSMGGMVGLAFTVKYPNKVVASCADRSLARCDTYERTLFRSWCRTRPFKS